MEETSLVCAPRKSESGECVYVCICSLGGGAEGDSLANNNLLKKMHLLLLPSRAATRIRVRPRRPRRPPALTMTEMDGRRT